MLWTTPLACLPAVPPFGVVADSAGYFAQLCQLAAGSTGTCHCKLKMNIDVQFLCEVRDGPTNSHSIQRTTLPKYAPEDLGLGVYLLIKVLSGS